MRSRFQSVGEHVCVLAQGPFLHDGGPFWLGGRGREPCHTLQPPSVLDHNHKANLRDSEAKIDACNAYWVVGGNSHLVYDSNLGHTAGPLEGCLGQNVPKAQAVPAGKGSGFVNCMGA